MSSKAILNECKASVLNMSYKCVRGFRAAEVAAAILALTPGLMHAQQPARKMLSCPAVRSSLRSGKWRCEPVWCCVCSWNFDTNSGP